MRNIVRFYVNINSKIQIIIMKKALLILSALCVLGSTAVAQETFYPGWQFGIKGGASYTAGESSLNDLISCPTVAVNAGYQFTPVFTLRGELSGFQAKGALPAIDQIYKFNYGQLNADAVFDICNMFNFKSERLFSPYLFAGIGGNVRFNNDEALAQKAHFEELPTNYLWDGSVLSFTGRVGAGVDIRLSDAVKLGVEVLNNALSDRFNSKDGSYGVDFDYNISAMLGLKFCFGQARKKAEGIAAAAAAAAEAEAARIAAEKAEAERIAAEKAAAEKAAREEAERLAAEKAAAEAAAAARAEARRIEEHVLFVIGKTYIRTAEQEKIQRVIDIMNQYPEAVVTVTGYADKNTGYASLNQRLSEKRAKNVAAAIEAAGISADRIAVNYVGDTQKVSEVPAENRVAVCITK